MGYDVIIGSTILGGMICMFMYYYKNLHLYKQASKFPGPPGLPFLGNALKFIGNAGDVNVLDKLVELSKLYSSPYRLWLGPNLLLIVMNHPEQIKTVLCSDATFEKSRLYDFFKPWLGNGLIVARASLWRVHRKLIGPTFNLKILQSFVEVFAAQSEIMVKEMEKKLNEDEFETEDLISLCAMDNICETAMGVTMKAQIGNARTYSETARKIMSIIYTRIFQVWLHPDAIFNRTQLGREHNEYVNTLHRFIYDVIQQKKLALRNHKDQECTVFKESESHDSISRKTSSIQRKAYLDLLMDLPGDAQRFTDTELREQVDTVIAAGHETTSTVINFVMLMLASYPDVQEKVYQELYEIYGSSHIDEQNVTYEELPRMEYMERMIKETMRLFPAAPTIARAVSEDLNIGEYTIPKGSVATVDIFALHRNHEYWIDPLTFNPDRFLPEEIAKRHSYSYIPFGGGPRICVGTRFAMMEMKTVIATVLRTYILKKDNVIPISDIKLRTHTTLKTLEPITLRIEKRKTVKVEPTKL